MKHSVGKHFVVSAKKYLQTVYYFLTSGTVQPMAVLMFPVLENVTWEENAISCLQNPSCQGNSAVILGSDKSGVPLVQN